MIIPAVRPLRLLLAVAAVLACAWFALAVRSAHELSRVSAIVGRPRGITAAQAAAAQAALRRAAVLDPDREIDVLRSQVELHAGQARRALATALAFVHQEPQNPANWLVLELASFRIDPAVNRLAQAELHRLVPPVGTSG